MPIDGHVDRAGCINAIIVIDQTTGAEPRTPGDPGARSIEPGQNLMLQSGGNQHHPGSDPFHCSTIGRAQSHHALTVADLFQHGTGLEPQPGTRGLSRTD